MSVGFGPVPGSRGEDGVVGRGALGPVKGDSAVQARYGGGSMARKSF